MITELNTTLAEAEYSLSKYSMDSAERSEYHTFTEYCAAAEIARRNMRAAANERFAAWNAGR